LTKNKFLNRLKAKKRIVYNKLLLYAKTHKFPGSGGKSVNEVLNLLIEGFRNSVLAIRASALSFKLMMAAIPALILVNTVIPLLLPDESKYLLMEILGTFLPEQIFLSIADPVSEVASGAVGSVISVTAIVAFYFAVNSMRACIAIFNNSYHVKENRPLLKQFTVALLLVCILLLVVIVSVPVFFLNQKVISWLIGNNVLSSFWSTGIVFIIKYVFFFLFVSVILTAIYFVAPAKKHRFYLFSPGTALAALLIVIASVGFDFFINEFTRYKEIYGGISALFILMLYIFIVSMIMLIGFEINAALYFGKEKTTSEIKI